MRVVLVPSGGVIGLKSRDSRHRHFVSLRTPQVLGICSVRVGNDLVAVNVNTAYDEALRIGSKIAILKDGVLVQVGLSRTILGQPANDDVRRFVEKRAINLEPAAIS